MSEPVRPENLGTILKEIERRLSNLETAPRGPHTSVKNGRMRFLDDNDNQVVVLDGEGLKVYDDSGNLRVRAGYINPTSGYGLSVFEAGGALMFEFNDDGGRTPALQTSFVPNLAAFNGFYTPVTAGAFADVYEAQFAVISHRGLGVPVICTSDVGTTGEFRIRSGAGGTTSAVTVPSGSAGTLQLFEWLHGEDISTGPTSFFVQARRTAGAGDVNVYLPTRAALMDPLPCSASGI